MGEWVFLRLDIGLCLMGQVAARMGSRAADLGCLLLGTCRLAMR